MNWPALRAKLDDYERLMRLDKPIGILLLLWPTLWGLWLAGDGRPDAIVLWIFVLGTALMRSAGCVINDYADRDFDPHVERTRERPLAARRVGTGEALALAGVLVLCAGLLILPLSKLVWTYAVAAVFLAASYPFTKRFFALPQAYLGIAFGFGIPMAYAAVEERLPEACWALLAANVFWSIAYDTEYAMVDRDDDAKIGIRTSALTFGRWDVAAVMASYAAMLAILTWLGGALRLRWPYYAGLATAGLIALWHWTMIRGRTREGCFRAFRHNNWLGAAIFAGIAASFL